MSPDPLTRVRRAARRLESAKSERDAAIAAAVASGLSARSVAKAANVSHVGVAKILERLTR